MVDARKIPEFKKREGLPELYIGDKKEVVFKYFNEEKIYSIRKESFEPAGIK